MCLWILVLQQQHIPTLLLLNNYKYMDMKKRLNRPLLLTALLLVMITCFSSCFKEDPYPLYGKDTRPPVSYNWKATADSLQEATYLAFLAGDGKTFKQDNSGNVTFHYWPNAHVLDVLTDGFLRTKNAGYSQRMKSLLAGIKDKNGGVYPNNFYDDMEWLALSSLRAYDATKDQAYLDVATLLWTDVKTGLNGSQGGGIAWKKDQLDYKNTPANAPAIILACRFYKLQNKAEDLALAKTLYTWLKTTLVDPNNGLVWDGINRQGNGTVDKDWVFTYNQGVFAGAGLELYQITNENGYLADALRTANTSINNASIAPSGLLRSEGQGDGGLFKGILIRYFTLLSKEPALSENDRKNLKNFIKFNAETLYTSGIAKPSLMIGPDWKSKPSGTTDLTTQLSGLMLIEAMASY